MMRFLIILIFLVANNSAMADWVKEPQKFSEGKMFVNELLGSEKVTFIREKGDLVYIIEGNVVILTHLFEYNQQQINQNTGKFFNYLLSKKAILCGNKLSGSMEIFKGNYAGSYKPYVDDFENDRTLIASSSYLYSGFMALSKNFLKLDNTLKSDNGLSVFHGSYEQICRNYGRKFQTKYYIGKRNGQSSADLQFPVLRKGFREVSFDEFVNYDQKFLPRKPKYSFGR